MAITITLSVGKRMRITVGHHHHLDNFEDNFEDKACEEA